MFKYYNHKLIKNTRSYTVKQICELFKDKGLHEQTIRSWVKDSGLPIVRKRPLLIHGSDLVNFIKNRNNKHQKTLEFHQFKCVKCGTIDSPKNNEIINIIRNANGSLSAKAICKHCDTKINKTYSSKHLHKIEYIFKVKAEALEILKGSLHNTTNTNFINPKTNVKNIEQEEKISTGLCTPSKTNLTPSLFSDF
jgi:predicted Zn-ribbon and HTH transcriptional regulator